MKKDHVDEKRQNETNNECEKRYKKKRKTWLQQEYLPCNAATFHMVGQCNIIRPHLHGKLLRNKHVSCWNLFDHSY